MYLNYMLLCHEIHEYAHGLQIEQCMQNYNRILAYAALQSHFGSLFRCVFLDIRILHFFSFLGRQQKRGKA